MPYRTASESNRGARVLALGLAISSFSLFALAQVSIGIAVGQPKTPVTIAAITANQDYYYSSVKLVNHSRSEVVAIAFGADAFTDDRPQPTLIGPFLLSVHLAPGATVTAPLNALPIASPVAPAGTGPVKELRLGIMTVRYSDGASWTYPYAAKHSFTPGAAKLTDAQAVPCGRIASADLISGAGSLFRHVAAFIPFTNYTCVPTSIFEYCENHNTSCTESGCTAGQGCAHQECQAIIPPHSPVSYRPPATRPAPKPALVPMRPPTERNR